VLCSASAGHGACACSCAGARAWRAAQHEPKTRRGEKTWLRPLDCRFRLRRRRAAQSLSRRCRLHMPPLRDWLWGQPRAPLGWLASLLLACSCLACCWPPFAVPSMQLACTASRTLRAPASACASLRRLFRRCVVCSYVAVHHVLTVRCDTDWRGCRDARAERVGGGWRLCAPSSQPGGADSSPAAWFRRFQLTPLLPIAGGRARGGLSDGALATSHATVLVDCRRWCHVRRYRDGRRCRLVDAARTQRVRRMRSRLALL